MRFELARPLLGCLILGYALPAVAEPLPPSPDKPVRQINRRAGVTEIVIHNPRATVKPNRAVEKTSAAPSLTSVNFQEVNVQAPRLAPVAAPVNRNSNPTAGVTWSQDWEPGPTAQMAANRGGTFGISIVPTYPIYPYPYWGNNGYASPYYGPAYYSGVSYNSPGYSSYYGPGYSSYSNHVGVHAVFRGGGRHAWYR